MDRLRPRRFARGLLLLAALLLAACEKTPPSAPPDRLVLTRVDFGQIPGWREDQAAAVLPALARSCARLAGQPAERPLGPVGPSAPGPGGLAGTVADWLPVCAELAALPAADHGAARAAFERHFIAYRAGNNERPDGLFTGYYEAELEGATMPDAGYLAPLYRRPDDLVTVDLGRFRADLEGGSLVGRVESGRLVPYYSRAEIEAGALAGRDQELLWARDPIDVFFLQIQGSGRIRLPDGSLRRIGFAASNGQSFTGIGRILQEEGELPRDGMSMQAIRAWLRAHPDRAPGLMARNARYIFFRWIEGEGPIGAQGVALTAGRSLAVDTAYWPLGVPLFLDTTWPGRAAPLRRLMVAQDSGAAIKGPIRGDFFWGTGEAALAHAGGMKERGVLYLLLPKAVAERRDRTS